MATTQASETQKKQHETTLSSYIWKLKIENTPNNIEWKILAKASDYSLSTRQCRLCLTEKFIIMNKPEHSRLNSRKNFVHTVDTKENTY